MRLVLLLDGLIAMLCLFWLWFPFLTFLGFSVIRAMVLQGFCGQIAGPLMTLLNQLKSDWSQAIQALEHKIDPSGTFGNFWNLAADDTFDLAYGELRKQFVVDIPILTPANVWNNKILVILMWVFLLSFTWFTWKVATYIIRVERLDPAEVIIKSIGMFVGMTVIELTFFSTFATKYVPINLVDIGTSAVVMYERERAK